MCFFANRVFVDQVSVTVVKTADSVLHTGGSPLVDLSLEPTENLEKRHVEFLKHGICVSYLSFPQRQKATAGTVLQRCLAEVTKFRNRMGRKLCVYKLGLTSNPVLRFDFYKDANYTHMSLLHVSPNLGLCQMLEAALIASNMSERECRNQRTGGEGPPSSEEEPFHFVYVVGARADQLKRIRELKVQFLHIALLRF